MKGSIRFNNDIIAEVDVDPSAASGSRLTSCKNLIDGQELGGGGGSSDYPTITATWHEDTQSYTYACDMTHAEISTLISSYDSSTYPGIYNEVGYGMEGGMWIPGEEDLDFVTPNGHDFAYDSDNVLTSIS